MILATLPAANIYDKMQRVAGHRQTPCSREELKRLQALAPRLRELGVERIVCSDLDGQSGFALARRLNVPVEEWQSLRRFNAGKLHGSDLYKFQKVYDSLDAPEVPVRGGDSLASYSKRIAASRDRLTKLRQTTLVVADGDVLARLTGSEGVVRYHIYQVEIDASTANADKAVAAQATR